jgi:hypothetical protein
MSKPDAKRPDHHEGHGSPERHYAVRKKPEEADAEKQDKKRVH